MMISVLIIGNVTTINNTVSAAENSKSYKQGIFKYANKLLKKYNFQGASVTLIKNREITNNQIK